MMPLTITYAELSEGLDILELALDEEFGKEIRSTTNVHDISTAIRARS
jgi:hypothetical protein